MGYFAVRNFSRTAVNGELRRGRKDPAEPVVYASALPTTAWSKLMRRWPHFETAETTTGHIIRYLPRDYKIFKVMEEGWEYPKIWQFVEQKRQRLLEKLWESGEPADSDEDVPF